MSPARRTRTPRSSTWTSSSSTTRSRSRSISTDRRSGPAPPAARPATRTGRRASGRVTEAGRPGRRGVVVSELGGRSGEAGFDRSDALGPGATEVAPERGAELFELAGVLGGQSARLLVLALDRLVHLLSVHADLDRGRDAQSDLIAPDIHHGDDDVIADDDAFVAVSGQDQHLSGSFLLPTCETRYRP